MIVRFLLILFVNYLRCREILINLLLLDALFRTLLAIIAEYNRAKHMLLNLLYKATLVTVVALILLRARERRRGVLEQIT